MAGVAFDVVSDGASLRMLDFTASDILSLVKQTAVNITTVIDDGTGGSDRIIGPAIPAISAYAPDQTFIITKGPTANTTTTRFIRISGLPDLVLTDHQGGPLAPGDLAAYGTFIGEIIGSSIRILGMLPSDVTTSVAAAFAVRVLLTSNINFYVAMTGSDTANTGLSAASPFATIQRAYNFARLNYELNGYTLTINVANGANYAPLVAAAPIMGVTGPSSVQIVGNVGNPASCVVAGSTTSNFAAVKAGVYFRVNGFRLTNTTSNLLGASRGGASEFGNMIFSTLRRCKPYLGRHRQSRDGSCGLHDRSRRFSASGRHPMRSDPDR